MTSRRLPGAVRSDTDVNLPTGPEVLVISQQAVGIKEGTRLMLIGWVEALVGTGATQFELHFREGISIADPDVAERQIVETIPGDRVSITGIAVTVAYQDDPVYGYFVNQLAASAAGTATRSALAVIPIA